MVLANLRQERFAQAYARLGNATHALIEVLGEERAKRMKRTSLRARASELKNHYLIVNRVAEIVAEMKNTGEITPHFRASTYRTDLFNDEEMAQLYANLERRQAELDIQRQLAVNKTFQTIERRLNRKTKLQK